MIYCANNNIYTNSPVDNDIIITDIVDSRGIYSEILSGYDINTMWMVVV